MKSHEAAVSFPLVRVWGLLRLFDSSFLPLAVVFLVASLLSDCSIEEKSEAKHIEYSETLAFLDLLSKRTELISECRSIIH